ncbi:MAG: hypothetical protein ABR523_09760, partial [Desulfurivibrionaceae bacterium]
RPGNPMTLYSIISAGKNFYYSHPYLALAIIACLAILVLIKPKAAFKTVAAILILLLIIYLASLLGQTSLTGMNSKKQMINQSRD